MIQESELKKIDSSQLLELNIMKFYGILLVVLGHVAFTYTPMALIKPAVSSEFMVGVKEIIYAFHMPMFVFISGCIFAWQLDIKHKSLNLESLFIKKFRRLMIPYYAFGLLMVWPTLVVLGFRAPLHYLIDGIILAMDPRHLWFVMALFIIFIMFYVFRKLCFRFHIPILTLLPFALLLYLLPVHFPYLQLENFKEYLLWFSIGYFFITHKRIIKGIALLALIYMLSSSWIRDVLPPHLLIYLLNFQERL